MKPSIKAMLALIRPHQHVKNLVIFTPLFFVGQITDVERLLNAVVAFVAFSVSTGGIYILNDYRDIEEDRQHAKKRYRPLASGAIAINHAVFLMSILLVMGPSLMAIQSFQAAGHLAIYIVLNIGYSICLKHIAIVDVTIVAIGFVLRLFVGSSVTDVQLSMWIVIMTFLLALFMALAKRRDDVLIFIKTGTKMRRVIDGYNLPFIDAAMMIMASVVIVAYLLYTTSVSTAQVIQSEHLYLTSIFVILAILRYIQKALVEKDTGSPTEIVLRDTFMKITILAWTLSYVWIIYL